MTTLQDRPNTALVVIDMQNDVVGSAPHRETVVENIRALVERARESNTPLIWVAHHDDELVPGTPAWDYVPELVRKDSEPLIHKSYNDAFEDTTLEEELAKAKIGHLVVSGAETDACIRSTIHGGAMTSPWSLTRTLRQIKPNGARLLWTRSSPTPISIGVGLRHPGGAPR